MPRFPRGPEPLGPEGAPVTAAERRRLDALQADRAHIELAAAWLRQNAWQESYAGLSSKDRAFALAAFMESVAMQLERIPPGLRAEAVRAAQWVTGGSRAVRF
jgi:hypothetical protein